MLKPVITIRLILLADIKFIFYARRMNIYMYFLYIYHIYLLYSLRIIIANA